MKEVRIMSKRGFLDIDHEVYINDALDIEDVMPLCNNVVERLLKCPEYRIEDILGIEAKPIDQETIDVLGPYMSGIIQDKAKSGKIDELKNINIYDIAYSAGIMLTYDELKLNLESILYNAMAKVIDNMPDEKHKQMINSGLTPYECFSITKGLIQSLGEDSLKMSFQNIQDLVFQDISKAIGQKIEPTEEKQLYSNYGDVNFFEYGILAKHDPAGDTVDLLLCRPIPDKEHEYIFASISIDINDDWIDRDNVTNFAGLAPDASAIDFAIACSEYYNWENWNTYAPIDVPKTASEVISELSLFKSDIDPIFYQETIKYAQEQNVEVSNLVVY